MIKKIHLSEKGREKLNRISHKNLPPANHPKTTSQPAIHMTAHLSQAQETKIQISVENFIGDEKVIGPTLDLFLQGVLRGNAMDKTAMDCLMQTVSYKMISHEFYVLYQKRYEEALVFYNQIREKLPLFK